jgi:CheY-like chemotaxis protein
MPDSADFIPELRRTLQSLRSAVHMLRQPQPDAGAIAFVCGGAEKRLEEILEGLQPEQPKGRRVLIADAERDWTETLGEALRQQGHRVDTAATLAQALSACAALRPDVVLVDIGMTGHEVASRLRNAGRSATLVAVTSWTREADRRLAKQAGIDHYLNKPISPAAVAELVSTLPPR